jgi:hypothetical protein
MRIDTAAVREAEPHGEERHRAYIIFNVDTSKAEAQLTVLRRIGPSKVAMLQEGIEWATFDKASTKCEQVA